MADYGAFKTVTPQEILAQQQGQYRDVMISGNVMQQRNARMQQALDGLFGNPQVRQAQRIQQSINAASKDLKQNEGEDQLDFELRRLMRMRDAVADIDPATASQINQRLLELGETKLQRSRLLAADTRVSEKHALDMDAAKREAQMDKLLGGNTYVVNPADNSAVAFDLMDPEQTAAFEAEKSKPGRRVLTRAEANQLMMQDDAQAAALRVAMAKADNDIGGGSKVTYKELEKLSGGLLDLHATAERIFNVFDSNPDVLTGGSKGAAALDKLATELGAAGRIASGGATKEGTSIDTWLKQNSIQNTRMQGLIVGLAYSLAKTNDPGGRLSDNDLRMAVQMVGGDNPNPAAILANLNDNMVKSSNALIGRIETSGDAVSRELGPRLALLKKNKEAYDKRMARYAQGPLGNEATGLAPSNTDIDDIVKKYTVPPK